MPYDENQGARTPGFDPESEGGDGHTRRRVLAGAAGAVVAAGSAGLVGSALAASSRSSDDVFSFIAIQEGFGVTFLSEAVRRAPGTPSAQFLPVLQSAVTTEFQHLRALEKLGHPSKVDKYWIPDAAFGAGGAGLFQSIAEVEKIEISLYLIGVTASTAKGSAFQSRLCAEALGTECEHRVLARSALVTLGASTEPPNNVGFESYGQRTVPVVKAALEGLGIGYGEQGATPGAFYEYPGSPLADGVGLPVTSTVPK